MPEKDELSEPTEKIPEETASTELAPEQTEPEEESDFADEAKPVITAPAETEKPAEPETPPEPEINWYLEKDAEPAPTTETTEESEPPASSEPAGKPTEEAHPGETPSEPTEGKKPGKGKKKKKSKPEPVKYTYDDEHLAAMEEARKKCNEAVKKINVWRGVTTGICVLIIVLAWVIMMIPEVESALSGLGNNASMIVTLIAAGIGLVGLAIGNYFLKKKTEAAMKEYFAEFFKHQTAYIYPADCTDIKGTVDTKLDEAKLKECGIYKDIVQVGSRACYGFSYHGVDVTVSDASGQSQEKKALRTVFVGKYVYFPNDYVGEDILIYFKGNKRALPPTNLTGRSLFQDSKRMVIYGPATTRRFLKAKVKTALAAFETNATFVDLAISVREGMTYMAVGFEDDLMVMPLADSFNPAPTIEAKKVMNQVLEFIDSCRSDN